MTFQIVGRAGATGLAFAFAAVVAAGAVLAQEGITRTELKRADLTGSDRLEVVVAQLEIAPGATVPPHSHPGDEFLIVFAGGPMRTADGRTINFDTGMAVSFPAGKVHGGLTAAGDTPIVLYTTHIVEKGKPMVIPAE